MAGKPTITVNIWERDLGLGRILAEAAKLKKKPYVKVGITQDKGSKVRKDGKLTVAEIAQIHEFGAPSRNIPERSFIRSTVRAKQEKYDNQLESLSNQVFDANGKMTIDRALGIIGQSVSSDMKATIRAGISPALSASTIAAKGSDVPLIDTGQMINAISYEVEMDGSKDGGGHE